MVRRGGGHLGVLRSAHCALRTRVIFTAAIVHGLAVCLLLFVRPVTERDRAQLDPEPELIPMRTTAKRLSRIALPSTYAVINSLVAVMPTLFVIRRAAPEMQTLLASVWMMSARALFRGAGRDQLVAYTAASDADCGYCAAGFVFGDYADTVAVGNDPLPDRPWGFNRADLFGQPVFRHGSQRWQHGAELLSRSVDRPGDGSGPGMRCAGGAGSAGKSARIHFGGGDGPLVQRDWGVRFRCGPGKGIGGGLPNDRILGRVVRQGLELVSDEGIGVEIRQGGDGGSCATARKYPSGLRTTSRSMATARTSARTPNCGESPRRWARRRNRERRQ